MAVSEILEMKLEISNKFLDTKLFKFPIFKIIHDDYDIKIKTKSSLKVDKQDIIKNLPIVQSKSAQIKCIECKKEITTFEFFAQKEKRDKIICNECYNILKEKKVTDEYIPLEKLISMCDKHGENYKLFCIDCNKNICPKCKDEHSTFVSKHEFIVFEDILKSSELIDKTMMCKKIKCLCKLLNNIAAMKILEFKVKEMKRFMFISARFGRENNFAENIISSFEYFSEKNALCYELISNFNEINYNKELEKINFQTFFEKINNLFEPTFHVIMQSSDVIEKRKIEIVPLCKRKRVISNDSLHSEIRGLIKLKNGFYLAASKNGDIGIFDSTNLELKQKFRLNGISNIFHLEKIKDENLDLIAVASDLYEVIIISVFPKEKDNKGTNEDIFDYKYEVRKKEHKGKLNRIIQLSNGLIVSSSEDELVIFWQLIKEGNTFNIQSITKIKMGMNIYNLIECKYTNELICNNQTINLDSYTIGRKLPIYPPGQTFNCAVCLFKEKFIAYVSDCDGIYIVNIQTGNDYWVTAKYDYVEAVYTIDNETFCLCTQDLYNIFGGRYSQQYKFDESDFVEIGKIVPSGTCNCYMLDSGNNFIMGDMFGELSKYSI